MKTQWNSKRSVWVDQEEPTDREKEIELCDAYEAGKIDEFEAASAIHIVDATRGLREAMFKNE